MDAVPGQPAAVHIETTAISLQWAPVEARLVTSVPIALEYHVDFELVMQQVKSGRVMTEQAVCRCTAACTKPTHCGGQIGGACQPAVLPRSPSCLLAWLTPCTSQYPPTFQVDEKLGLPADRWSVQYMGSASFVQVKGLRPGRTYAARVAAVPVLTTPHEAGEVVLVRSPPSEVVTVQTLPCPPMGQPAPQLASRLKKELKVGGRGCRAALGPG